MKLFVCFVVLLSMERLINDTAAYCAQRKAFGKSILDNQYVHFRLAELQTEVELLRSLVYRTTGGCPVPTMFLSSTVKSKMATTHVFSLHLFTTLSYKTPIMYFQSEQCREY